MQEPIPLGQLMAELLEQLETRQNLEAVPIGAALVLPEGENA